MAIGDKYRAKVAELEGREQADEGLSGEQLKAVLLKGLSLSDARELANAGLSFEDICEVADAQKSNVQSGGDMGTILQQNAVMMEQVLSRAKNRRPEAYNGDVPHRWRSAFNPDGADAPTPPLKCKMHEGYWDAEKETAVDRWEIEGSIDGLGPNTKLEVLLANRLEPGEYRVRNHDGIEGLVRVVAQKSEATGAVTKLTIAYPHNWVDKASKGRLKPSLLRVFCDIYDIGSEKPDHMLAWLKKQDAVAA
jgi:hypothetical protein